MGQGLRKGDGWSKLHKREEYWPNLQKVFLLSELPLLLHSFLESGGLARSGSSFLPFLLSILGSLCCGIYTDQQKQALIWLPLLKSRLLILGGLFVCFLEGFATLNKFVCVGRQRYFSAWFAVTGVLNTLKNSV